MVKKPLIDCGKRRELGSASVHIGRVTMNSVEHKLKHMNSTTDFSVTHSGNIASNGYYNDRLLRQLKHIELPLRPTSNYLRHAFSQPAWELLDLDQSDIVSIDDPVWKPEHRLTNYHAVSPRSFVGELATLIGRKDRTSVVAEGPQVRTANDSSPSAVFGPRTESQLALRLLGIRKVLSRFLTPAQRRTVRTIAVFIDPIFQSLILTLLIRFLGLCTSHLLSWPQKLTKNRPNGRCALHSNWIHISIGPTRYSSRAFAGKRVKHVLIEHGTLRWSHSPGSDNWDQDLRNRFKASCSTADHIWITNLDARTLELASTYCRERWSAFPHPYVVDPLAPYEPEVGARNWYRELTNADYLVLSGSSLNLRGDQNKGTQVLLDAISVIRHDLKLPIGFIFVAWGVDVTAVKSYCRENRLDDYIHFAQPMSRIRLMKTMASCDLVSDQFHLDAFGSFSLRAWEQGMPIMSRPISSYAASLIGDRPPVVAASSTIEIVEAVSTQYLLQTRIGRQPYLTSHAQESRSWFLKRHHHILSQQMQTQRYSELLMNQRPPALPDLWSRTHLVVS